MKQLPDRKLIIFYLRAKLRSTLNRSSSPQGRTKILWLMVFVSTLYTLHSTLTSPVYAQGFSLKDAYGFGDINSFAEGIGRLIIPAFTLAAVAVIFYFLFGAFQYITSAGDKNKIQTARGKIIHAIIGFILLIAMFFILQILPELFGLGGFVLIS